jgi:hypothetical protein
VHDTETLNSEVRGPVNDLWDKPLRFRAGAAEVRLLDFDLTASGRSRACGRSGSPRWC